ncbi:MAG: CAP domain-containing protein [Bacteroidota bacterium]
MKRSVVLLSLWIWAICLFSQTTPATYPDLTLEVYRAVNTYRKSIGLNALSMKKELNAIALEHSNDMAKGRVPFSHNGFQGRVNKVRKYAKIPYRVAENLYGNTARYQLATTALRDWLNSPGHAKNIKGNFLFTGMGIARSKEGEYFITQIFVGKN